MRSPLPSWERSARAARRVRGWLAASTGRLTPTPLPQGERGKAKAILSASCSDCDKDLLEHRIGLSKHGTVPETENPESGTLKPR